jgi:hypothetical protein
MSRDVAATRIMVEGGEVEGESGSGSKSMQHIFDAAKPDPSSRQAREHGCGCICEDTRTRTYQDV